MDKICGQFQFYPFIRKVFLRQKMFFIIIIITSLFIHYCTSCAPTEILRQGQYKIPRPIEELMQNEQKLKEFYANYSISTSTTLAPFTLSTTENERLARLQRTEKPVIVSAAGGGGGGKVVKEIGMEKIDREASFTREAALPTTRDFRPYVQYTEEPGLRKMVERIGEHSISGGYPVPPNTATNVDPSSSGVKKLPCCDNVRRQPSPVYLHGGQPQVVSYYNTVNQQPDNVQSGYGVKRDYL